MRALIFIVCLCIVTTSFAAETETDCPMMKEQNLRSNPKANLSAMKPKIQTRKGTSKQ